MDRNARIVVVDENIILQLIERVDQICKKIDGISLQKEDDDPVPLQEAIEMLHISKTTFYSLIKQIPIERFKLGGKVYIRKGEIKKLLIPLH